MNKNNQFSMADVIAIAFIATALAFIIVPNYKLAAQNTKSAEAKSNLSIFYTAQRTFHSQWGHYDGGFLQIGFHPEGVLSYEIASSSLYKDTNERLNYILERLEEHNQTRYLQSSAYCDGYELANCEIDSVTAVRASHCYTQSSTNDDFVACASANFGNAKNDEWSINHNKNIIHVSGGE